MKFFVFKMRCKFQQFFLLLFIFFIYYLWLLCSLSLYIHSDSVDLNGSRQSRCISSPLVRLCGPARSLPRSVLSWPCLFPAVLPPPACQCQGIDKIQLPTGTSTHTLNRGKKKRKKEKHMDINTDTDTCHYRLLLTITHLQLCLCS